MKKTIHTGVTALLFARDYHGCLGQDQIEHIYEFMRNPNTDTWSRIAHQHIRVDAPRSTVTIWQAVVEQDATFPSHGRRIDRHGNVIRDWERIPTPYQVFTAINKTIFTYCKN